MYAFLADALVVFHLCYVCFCVGGELCILTGAAARWSWIRNSVFRIVHLCAVVFVGIEAGIGVLCPLTNWEYDLRLMAGQTVERDISFIGRLIRSVIFYDFPPWIFTAMYIGFAGIVILSFVLIRPVRKKRERKKSS